MGFFDVIMGIVGLGGLGILSLSGVAVYGIRKDYNQEKEKLQLQKVIEERRLEEVRQENYLLENADMRKELEEIRAAKLSGERDDGGKRWLIKETK